MLIIYFILFFIPNTAIDSNAVCEQCSSTAENWLCLSCYKILCGRYVMEHMLFHSIETSHPLALSFSDLSVWCYPCEAYIDNSKLHVYKNLLHRHKFGEDMVWSYPDIKCNNGNDSDNDDYDADDAHVFSIQLEPNN